VFGFVVRCFKFLLLDESSEPRNAMSELFGNRGRSREECRVAMIVLPA
jgi:hypothetical protein